MGNQQHHGFARHYVEMILAMLVGMLVLGAALRGVLALTDTAYAMSSHPELVVLEMAFTMSAGMALWMRRRGHAWPGIGEMCAAMFLPALVLVPLLSLDVVAPDAAMAWEHLAMLPLMFVVMLRRRTEYGV
ncbi:hypothetical protein HLK59_46345 [Streptomyces sp. S3(2020)]|uniref:hypothetical protein n=1 Tax=Streptomyces sp. S3(2020) TaxID=2732044 RepID=UPI00148903DA|nr:hypothetical protein [Streptomyces sp. S3(2020)]NNN37623.1 hypothetical protein [Streptomyces sp. S3(2020)]